MRIGNWILGSCLSVLCSVLPSMADDVVFWPQFRGPGARGLALGTGVPEVWSATENVAWKRDVPGR
ncbi:MAG: hypothetical protein ACK5A1_00220, partial [Planctomyces sp.]